MKQKNNLLVIIVLVIISAKFNDSLGQSTQALNQRTAGWFLGWDNTGTSGSLEIHNDFTVPNGYPIDFYTNAVPQATLDANGNFSIGQTSTTNYFGIGTATPVLWHNGNTFDIFVGVGAGNATMGGHANTYVGFHTGIATNDGSQNVIVGTNAGQALYDGVQNVFIGSNAGFSITDGSTNVFVGYEAGKTETTAGDNTFVGYQAGLYNLGGTHNSFFGDNAGFNTASGRNNTFIGAHCGENNTTGTENTVVGNAAGNSNITGDNTLFLGNGADASSGSLTNASAIGAHAIVGNDNTMILGREDVDVGIGMSNIGPLSAKLHVQRQSNFWQPNGVNVPTGIFVDNPDQDIAGQFLGFAYGLNSETSGTNMTNYAVYGRATNASRDNFGGLFVANGAFANPSNARNTGAKCVADRGVINYGLHASIPVWNPLINVWNVAVYGQALANPPIIPPAPPGVGSWAGYFNGDLGYTGTLYIVSDSSFKTDIEPLSPDTASSILSQINVYTYHFDSSKIENSANVSTGKQIGFFSQEIEAAAPELVLNTIFPAVEDTAGNVITPAKDVKMYNPIGIIALLVEGYKELKASNQFLQDQLAMCCSGGNRSSGNDPGNTETPDLNTGSIELENINAIQLEQSDPNPFSQNTIIRWSIPTDFHDAMIYFYDGSGNQINKYKIAEKGNGELQVFGSKLAAGIYSYSLVVDGKLIDSKKMLKSR